MIKVTANVLRQQITNREGIILIIPIITQVKYE